MPVRYGRFEMPKTLTKEESSATDTYAKFIAEPFEAGYGHTGRKFAPPRLALVARGRCDYRRENHRAQHEFATLPGVVEDVTDIVLNLKRVKFKAAEH
jgi:DNA-directed RNA polymerase subunit alpha